MPRNGREAAEADEKFEKAQSKLVSKMEKLLTDLEQLRKSESPAAK